MMLTLLSPLLFPKRSDLTWTVFYFFLAGSPDHLTYLHVDCFVERNIASLASTLAHPFSSTLLLP